MSEEKQDKPRFQKGDRAAIVSGRKNLGVRGEVFWIGENKYGPGVRYGLRGEDGETYWVDGSNIGTETEAPPAPELPPLEPELAKGTIVTITGGREGVGEEGAIFWVGESKYGRGKRYGVKVSEEETYWVDQQHVEAVEGAPPATPASRGSSAPKREPAGDEPTEWAADGGPPADAPMPDPDDFSDEELDHGAPFPPDDIPF